EPISASPPAERVEPPPPAAEAASLPAPMPEPMPPILTALLSPKAGELPPDLLAAFNAAVELATQADEIDMVLRMACGPGPSGQYYESLLSIVQSAEEIINHLWQ